MRPSQKIEFYNRHRLTIHPAIKTDPKTKKVARKLMPRPGSKKIARSRRGGLLAGEFRRTLGSTRNPRHTNLGSESQLA